MVLDDSAAVLALEKLEAACRRPKAHKATLASHAMHGQLARFQSLEHLRPSMPPTRSPSCIPSSSDCSSSRQPFDNVRPLQVGLNRRARSYITGLSFDKEAL